MESSFCVQPTFASGFQFQHNVTEQTYSNTFWRFDLEMTPHEKMSCLAIYLSKFVAEVCDVC